MIETIGTVVFVAALAYAAYCDLTSYQIPNWVSLAIVADFIVTGAVGSLDLTAIAWHLGTGLAMLAVGLGLFTAGIFGGGDAKLLAASAVWFGWTGLFTFIVLVAIIGGLLALLIICLRRIGLPASWTDRPWVKRLCSRDQGIPYAIAIAAAGGLMIVPLPIGIAPAVGAPTL